MKTIYSVVIMLILLSMLFIIGCDEKQEKPADQNQQISEVAKDTALTLINPWVRLAGKGRNTALFVDIVNGTQIDDTLLSVESDIAELVEIHETYKRENNMMGMRQVQFVALPAGDTVSLKPMSLHVMLIGLKQNLKIDDTVSAVMNFSNNAPVTVNGIVKEFNKTPPKMAE